MERRKASWTTFDDTRPAPRRKQLVELNPYESPRGENNVTRPQLGGADSVLLVEIRDGQRELIELHHQAATRLSRQRLFSVSFALLISLLTFLLMAWTFNYTRAARPPLPARAAPAPVITPPLGS
jgi:hypothetical protein